MEFTGLSSSTAPQQEVFRKDWMFKLVGKEPFSVGSTEVKAAISIEAVTGLSYEYTLEVNGKSLQTFRDNRSRTTKTWLMKLDGVDTRVVLEKDTMDVWCNGQKMETMGEFADDGTETHFTVGDHDCCIKAISSGKKRKGIVHVLLVDGTRASAQAE
ncbi:fas apoptotic inhibitory molecule b isoform X2 [Denticeps clupeoides]|uniref:fas apoptotic inhibitory molecule b isoform X2 n=1 Tax=Denticeps clupeoides TaxID=299321 RepID=UPI0010A4A735|nr:fas apoptotic inhibitory molecule 1-like isoform X2 [Denticeps clupeoides]